MKPLFMPLVLMLGLIALGAWLLVDPIRVESVADTGGSSPVRLPSLAVTRALADSKALGSPAHLFTTAVTKVSPPAPKPVTVAPAQVSALTGWKLTGLVRDGGGSYATVLGPGGKVETLQLGATLDAWTLAAIMEDRVVLRHQAQTFELLLRELPKAYSGVGGADHSADHGGASVHGRGVAENR